jgi:hypothetical protein
MMLELSERLFSDFVSFFGCTLYSHISPDFGIPYFIFIFAAPGNTSEKKKR